jgi:hypothetical protein
MKKWVHIFLPLVVGGSIYLFFHKPDLLLHQYIKTPNYYHLFKENRLFQFCLNYVPDILWAYSLSHFLFLYLLLNYRWKKLVIVIILVSFSECIQLYLPNIFTFDIYDLILNVSAAFLHFLCL